MNNVMNNGFTNLSVSEMNEINGGLGVSINFGPVSISVTKEDLKDLYGFYKNKYVPAAERFGGKVYDYASIYWTLVNAIW